jgi:3-oxoadipate enol-lactonase
MDHRALARRISRPVAVVAGTMDRVTTPDDASWLAAQIPGAEMLTLPAAHLANVEAAGQFNEVVAAFLSSPEV